jgi:CubicO group peptidase (beta-lactamase class C family)
MNTGRKKRITLTIVALMAGVSIYAQDIQAEIDNIFSWATPAAPGCVCAVSQHGKVVVNRAYGAADLERPAPLKPNSVFDAGSLTKQFVAAATLLLVEEGRFSLSDDIRKNIPELPDYGHKITVDHLLTHTSGLRDWPGIANLAEGDADALTMVLRQRGLNFVPGEEWSYSNSGYVLLKEMIARTSGMPFSEFARRRLFEPLGMGSTSYRDDLRDLVKDRALGYQKEGDSWEMAMMLDNDRGGGGALFTTAGDLLLWNEAMTSGRLGAFVTAKIREPARLSNGRTLGYARGLFLDSNRGGPVIWHTGSADGYKSLLSRYPDQGLSIAILCNSGDGTDRTAFARRIFDLFVPGTRAPEAEPPTADSAGLSAQDLTSREGWSIKERTGEPLRLVVDRGRLRVGGGPVLVALSKDRFRRWGDALSFMSQDEFELHFLPQGGFDLKSMEGKTTRYRRAEAFTPAPTDLEAFAGRFESDEIGSAFRITAGEGGLTIHLEHTPANKLEFRPVDRDVFQFRMLTVRFLRDKAGKVVALDFTNPVLRNVRFTRTIERADNR